MAANAYERNWQSARGMGGMCQMHTNRKATNSPEMLLKWLFADSTD